MSKHSKSERSSRSPAGKSGSSKVARSAASGQFVKSSTKGSNKVAIERIAKRYGSAMKRLADR